MRDKVVIISCNQESTDFMKNVIEKYDKQVLICSSITNFAKCFMENEIESYILDLTDAKYDRDSAFYMLYNAFLQNIPSDSRIVCGTNINDKNQIPLSAFTLAYIELLVKKEEKKQDLRLCDMDKVSTL